MQDGNPNENGNGQKDMLPVVQAKPVKTGGSALAATAHFLVDYSCRHAHPVNAVLHLVGVPAVVLGLYKFFFSSAKTSGVILIFAGYLLQYLGHKSQGNEVGEVTLLKRLYALIRSRCLSAQRK